MRFAVWAPNAEVVTVVGEFNHWDTRRHPMRLRNGGIWELFVPELGPGMPYKYYVRSRHLGHRQLKADPYGFACEIPPKSASVVADLTKYEVEGRRLDGAPRPDELAEVADVDLRGPPRVVAAQTGRHESVVSRDGRLPGAVRQGDGLHPHRAAAHDGASVLGIVGLPGDRLLRADVAVRHAGRFHDS